MNGHEPNSLIGKYKLIESKINITETFKMNKINPMYIFTFIYFEDLSVIGIFKGDITSRENLKLPLFVYKLIDIKTVNYRIAEKLNEANYVFKGDERSITIRFQNERLKESISDKIKTLIKDGTKIKEDEEEISSYSPIELKYKLVKILESMSDNKDAKKYDYRSYLNYDYLKKFVNIYNKGSEEYKYYYNRLFIGKIGFMTKTEKELKGKDLSKVVTKPAKEFLVVFLLSRGLYDLKKHPLKNYVDITFDFTKKKFLPYWMETDTIYLFKEKNIKINVKDKFVPFHHIYKIDHADSFELISSDLFSLKIKQGDKTDFLIFNNIIEIWKFYSYAKILQQNHLEINKSLIYDIKMNIRILFDGNKFSSINNLMDLLMEKTHLTINKDKPGKRKSINDDTHYYESILVLYENLMISFYSNPNLNAYIGKFKMIINEIHKIYILEIKEILSNKYTEVS